jgi:hypothetical protein
MMHIVPSSKIPFAKIPLDIMISNKVNYLKKDEKRGENFNFKPSDVELDAR